MLAPFRRAIRERRICTFITKASSGPKLGWQVVLQKQVFRLPLLHLRVRRNLFCKNRFLDYARSILVCVGICFAKTGVSIAGALFSHVCSCLHDTRQVPTFRRRIGVSRAGTRSGIAIAHAGWCPGTPRNKKTELWFGTANWRGGFCHTPPRPQRGTSPSPREVFDRATFSHSAIDHRSTIRHVSPVESRHRGGLKGTSRIGVRDMLSYQRPAARLAGGETQRYLLQSWPSAAWS